MKLLSALMLALSLSVSFVQAESIKLATLNWEPFYGESLPESGFFAALSEEAFNRAGYEVEFHFVTWKRALENAKKGQYDGLLGAYYSEDRTKHFVYTDVIYSSEEVFIKRKKKNIPYASVESLRPYKIGGLRASAPLVELKELGYTVDDTTEEIASLQKLLLGRVDVVLMGKSKFLYDAQHQSKIANRANEFEILQPAYKSYDLFCPITKQRKDAMEIVKRFNKALADMKSDGTYAAILERFNQK